MKKIWCIYDNVITGRLPASADPHISTSAHQLIRTLLLFLIFSQSVAAVDLNPTDSAGVKNINGQKFLLYKVEQGQTWYSIGRRFGLAANDIQTANEDVRGKPLNTGQIVLIPLAKGAPSTIEAKTAKAGDVPVYYSAKKGETLYSIAVKNRQTMQEIRRLNDLKSDKLYTGQKLIVGYERKANERQRPVNGSASPAGMQGQAKPIPTGNNNTMKTADTTTKNTSTKGLAIEEHGIASFIEDQDINPNKYYALHRTAPKGTIIKVTNIMNKKQIYVKVIGALPDTGDNNDLIIKISKSSATRLNVLDARFQVVLNYFGE